MSSEKTVELPNLNVVPTFQKGVKAAAKTSASLLPKTIRQHVSDENLQMLLYLIVIILVIFIGYLFYFYLANNNNDCSDLPSLDVTLRSFNTADKDYQHNLRDYYIKSSYNSCAHDDFDNTFVKMCALDNVIKSGARFLDFEIYSMSGEPVISVSNGDDFNTQQSFKQLGFKEVMSRVKSRCFSSSGCPNPDDPVFLHFRIKSSRSEICNKMAKELEIFEKGGYLLGPNFSKGFFGNNLGIIPLRYLSKNGELEGSSNSEPKVVIIVSNENKVYIDTPLYEYVNIESGSPFLSLLRETSDIANAPSQDELKEQNKRNMTIAIPDPIPQDGGSLASLHCCVPDSFNLNFTRDFSLGCQFVTMCYQNKDEYLEKYTKFFNEKRSAFVLKAEELRYIPKTIPAPTPQKKENSFAKRTVSADYFKFNI
jgi:hypothetical protein